MNIAIRTVVAAAGLWGVLSGASALAQTSGAASVPAASASSAGDESYSRSVFFSADKQALPSVDTDSTATGTTTGTGTETATRTTAAAGAGAATQLVTIATPAASLDSGSGYRQTFDPAPYVLTDSGRSVVMGRYTTTSADPPSDLIEPIKAVASLTFPRQTVHSIREAIDYCLLRSGYRFDPSALNDAERQFLDLPLPESQRQIGPYPLSTILSILLGSAWQPVVNLENRTVSVDPTPTSLPCTTTGQCGVRVTWMSQGATSLPSAVSVKPGPSGVPSSPVNPAPKGVAVSSARANRGGYAHPKTGDMP